MRKDDVFGSAEDALRSDEVVDEVFRVDGGKIGEAVGVEVRSSFKARIGDANAMMAEDDAATETSPLDAAAAAAAAARASNVVAKT